MATLTDTTGIKDTVTFQLIPSTKKNTQKKTRPQEKRNEQ